MTDLVKRAKKGDKEAFILLMDHHRQMLYNTALLVLHREDDALDAIQDTILACWENLPSLQKDRYFKTWLVRILLNGGRATTLLWRSCRNPPRSQTGTPAWMCAGPWPSWAAKTSLSCPCSITTISVSGRLPKPFPFPKGRCAHGSHGAGTALRNLICRRKENVYERRSFPGTAPAGAPPPEPLPQGHAAL